MNGQVLYDFSASSTSELVRDIKFDDNYGDHSYASGSVYTDIVSIGDISVYNQKLGVAEDAAQSFTNDPTFNGIFGLGT